MEISEDFHCLFTAQIRHRDDSYVIEIPEREVSIGEFEEDELYRISVMAPEAQLPDERGRRSKEAPDESQSGPLVEEGEILDVEIEDIGDQGDGIARIGPGYIVFMPDTEIGERVAIEITKARETVAFAEVVERYDRIE